MDNSVRKREAAEGSDDSPHEAQVTAYGSGNLAQVYFDLHARKINLSELDQAYPGMVEALIEHEGIGLVCGYEEDGTPVVLGKNGKRNLYTGEVIGQDPLKPYASEDPDAFGASSLETRVWQVRRVMDFPNAGDLMVISTVYPDGTVAALEELIGNHGGLGGEQTDAFIFHPPSLAVGSTRNAIDVFQILNDFRSQPISIEELEEEQDPAPTEDEWSWANLWAGLKDVRTWLGYASHALILDRSTYQNIVNDRRMTGPALLLGVGFSAISAFLRADPGYRAAISTRWNICLVVVCSCHILGGTAPHPKRIFYQDNAGHGICSICSYLGFVDPDSGSWADRSFSDINGIFPGDLDGGSRGT